MVCSNAYDAVNNGAILEDITTDPSRGLLAVFDKLGHLLLNLLCRLIIFDFRLERHKKVKFMHMLTQF